MRWVLPVFLLVVVIWFPAMGVIIHKQQKWHDAEFLDYRYCTAEATDGDLVRVSPLTSRAAARRGAESWYAEHGSPAFVLEMREFSFRSVWPIKSEWSTRQQAIAEGMKAARSVQEITSELVP